MVVLNPEHANVNLPPLVVSLKARVADIQKENWVQVRSGRENVKYAREMFNLVQSANSLPSLTLKTIDEDLFSIEKAFDEAIEDTPIPSSSRNPLSTNSVSSNSKSTSALPPSSAPSNVVATPQSIPNTQSSLDPAPPAALSPPINLPPLVLPQDDHTEDETELLFLPVSNQQNAKDELLAGHKPQGRDLGTYMGASQVHEELGSQLAEMSGLLKRNAIHFSKSLEDEKSLIESSTSVLEGNLEKTKASKGKLASVSKKTRGTTWMTLGIIAVVMFAFFWTLLLIRMT